MNTFFAKETLPEGYAEAEKIDLVKNKKQMLLVNGLAIALAVICVLTGIAIQPLGQNSFLFSAQDSIAQMLVKLAVVIAGIFAYIAGHEAVHGVFMWRYSHVKPRFGFSFTYAYAGSDCYFAKNAYLVIALAPAVVWFACLGVLSLLVPSDWFWVVWLIQVMNISGAAGDFYVFARMLKKPDTVLVQDTGTAMTVYLPE